MGTPHGVGVGRLSFPVAAGIPESAARLRMALTWALSVWFVNSHFFPGVSNRFMIQPSLKGVCQWPWKGKASVNSNPKSNPAPTPIKNMHFKQSEVSVLECACLGRDLSFLFSFGTTGAFPSNQILSFSVSKLQDLLSSAKL